MTASLQRRIGIGYFVAFLVLLGIGVASFRGVRDMQAVSAAERKSSAVLAAASELSQTITDAETGHRGYLLTGDQRYLVPYRRALLSLERVRRSLLATRYPEDSLLVTHLLGVVDRKLAVLVETVDRWERGDHEGALALLRTSRGRSLMDTLRADTRTLRQLELGRIEGQRVLAGAEGDRVALIIMLGTLIAAAIAASATALVVMNARQREQARRALVRANEAAETATRAKGEFIERMSHELRTPLNSIIGFSGVLMRNKRAALDARELAYLSKIEENGRRLLTIINDILEHAKIESGRLDVSTSPVDLLELVRQTAESFEEPLSASDVVLALDLPDQLDLLQTNGDKLRQVITNLLANALRFTERGRVVVRVLAAPNSAKPWRLDVIDEGMGVAPSRQAAIFGAFEQAENTISRRFGGTGLGLAFSKSVCERLGFGLTVVSSDGVGSTFSILFDSAARPPLRHEPPAGGVPLAVERRRLTPAYVRVVES
ncbi:MAG: CHASE3 domain-containing protein [Gemmatimonadota bacterium]